ncbi:MULTISPECIES: sulfotransferase [Roseicyclus]|jgi:hypothetical protein
MRHPLQIALRISSIGNGLVIGMTEPVFDHLLLGVGAMKAGTTWLYDVLNRHPEVHFSHEKEIHFFYAQALRPGLLSDRARMRRAKGYLAFDPEISHARVLQRRVRWTANWLANPIDDAWFNGLFLHKDSARWIADFSNLNALLPAETWRDIHARTRKLRVIYTLREPIDRLWSHVRFHLKMQGKSHLLDEFSVDELFTHIKDGDYLEHTDYVAAIMRMREGLPQECLRIDFFDRVSSDPRGFVADIESFLELTPQALPDDIVSRVVNPSPPRPLPAGLAERLEPFVEAQREGLRRLGLVLPDHWG